MIIYKYPLKWDDPQTLQSPGLQRILSVQLQNFAPMLWAMVDENDDTAPVCIRIFGTGNRLPPEPGEFIDTVQVGSFVSHFFKGEVAT